MAVRAWTAIGVWAAAWVCAARADVWTDPKPVHALRGAGDVLVAATSGGVVLWDLSGTRAHNVTTMQGLSSHVVHDVALSVHADRVCAATDNGLARGWFHDTWVAVDARNDEQGRAWFACATAPSGAFLAGGDRGALRAWRGSRVDSLRVPTRTGRVVGLDVAPAYFDAATPGVRRATRVTSSRGFPVGLVVATDNDGVWFLRDAGMTPRWLRVGERDGLPSRDVRDVAVDAQGFVWVATHAGLARIGPGVRVTTFAVDSLLSRRIEVLLHGADGALYAGVGDGVVRIDPASQNTRAERIVSHARPIVALAWSLDTLWWSDGESVRARTGGTRALPLELAANAAIAIARLDDTTWVGHPFGRVSHFADGAWTRLAAEHGLPPADVRDFLRRGAQVYAGTTSGLYVHDAETAPPGDPQFQRVPGAPDDVVAQAAWRGAHWVGGANGLWRTDGDTWRQVRLWSGAHAITALDVVRDTLWASAGYDGIACHDGARWGRPPVVASLVGAYWGRVATSAKGRIAFATSRGVAQWQAGIVRDVRDAPNVFVTDVAWWNDHLAVGEPRGLWLHAPDGSWRRLGVLDGLPGARVRGVAADATSLWIATTRGVGRFLPSDFDFALASVRRAIRTAERVPSPLHALPSGVHVVRGARAVWTLRVGTDSGARLLHLYDVRGRRVRVLRRGASGGFEWDTRDVRGRALASGVFFARPGRALDVPGVSPAPALRIVLIR